MSEQQWKLVPVEPTEEMVSVFSEMLEAVDDGCSSSGKDLLRKFIATIAAAPRPPALGGDAVVIGNLHRDCDERIVFESSGELHIKDGMPVYGADSVARLQAEVERLNKTVSGMNEMHEAACDKFSVRTAALEGLLRELSNEPFLNPARLKRINAALAEGAKS